MKILVDQSLGLPDSCLEPHGAVVRKTPLKKGESLEDVIEKGKGKVFTKSLSLIKKDLQSEIDEFHKYFHETEQLFYLYDSKVTDSRLIKRISNWNFPNRKLYLVDGSSNRAFAIHLLKELTNHPFEEVYRLSHLCTNQKFTISNDLKYQKSANYLRLKEGKQKTYHLLKGTNHTKITSGQKLELIEKVLATLQGNTFIIASRGTMELPDTKTDFYRLKNEGLPISSDKVDIFIPI